MGMGTVSHDTSLMRDWSVKMDVNAEDYDALIIRLYTLVDQFVGSAEFKGGLSEDFMNNVMNQRKAFFDYSDTFRECANYIKSTSHGIDDDEHMLKNMMNTNNPLA